MEQNEKPTDEVGFFCNRNVYRLLLKTDRKAIRNCRRLLSKGHTAALRQLAVSQIRPRELGQFQAEALHLLRVKKAFYSI